MPAQGTSSYWGTKRWTELGAIDDLDIDADNDKFEYGFPQPVRATRLAVIPTTNVANASGTVEVEVYRADAFGSQTEDTLLGTIVVTDTTTLSVGDIMYANLVGEDESGSEGSDGSTVHVGPSGPYEIAVGEGLVFKVVEPADSGAVRISVEYIPLPVDENDDNVARVHEVPAA